MPDAVICGYARTPFGKFRGALSAYTAVELGTMVVSELLTKAGIDAGSGVVDQVYIGQVLQAGGTGEGGGAEEERELWVAGCGRHVGGTEAAAF